MSVSLGAMLTIPINLERASCPSPVTLATPVPALRPCELIWMFSTVSCATNTTSTTITPSTEPNTDDDTISTVTLYDREDGIRHPSPEQQNSSGSSAEEDVVVMRPIPLRPMTIAQMSLWTDNQMTY